ncbi:apoptosis regulatory protein Siva-like isoform X2 [Drosophila innubila]|nr:apoptosis regulatory protein Siva-like isoform X2 [Drosophila innubila]
MLFQAAAKDAGNQQQTTEPQTVNLYEQYQLIGDGNIILRDLNPDVSNPGLERRLSTCCQRPTLIRGTCANCTFDLCEECGYSCVECNQFICRTCVTLFGNRPEEAERPLCEVCQMFVA